MLRIWTGYGYGQEPHCRNPYLISSLIVSSLIKTNFNSSFLTLTIKLMTLDIFLCFGRFLIFMTNLSLKYHSSV